MPGIVAIVGRGTAAERGPQLRTMLASMRHDPSYVCGEVLVPDLGVWSGWLAHPDSFASRVSAYRHPDGSAVLFCGECFPGSEGISLAQLADAGRFAACVIDGCRREGSSFLKRLNGMFSGLLIDRTIGRCIIFNDRFGCERLHVSEAGGDALFASEAKALLHARSDLRAFEPQAVAQYLAFGSISGGQTLFRGISLLPGASAWEIGSGGLESRARYFLPSEWAMLPELDEHEFQEALSDLMATLVPTYLAGDHAIGISITAGLDTRMIMASLPTTAAPGVCYTYAGLRGETLDSRLGAQVARTCGWPHQVIRIAPDFLRDYPSYVDRTVYVTDGCAGPLEAHEIYLTKQASRLARIRLTGNYGSEVLRGMSTLKPRQLQRDLLCPSFAASVASAAASTTDGHPVVRAAFEEVPFHLFGTLAAARSALVVRTPYMDNELVRLAVRAPATARQGASAALRLIRQRSPLLAAIPTDQGRMAADRQLVRDSLRAASAALSFKLDYWHKEGLPGGLAPFGPALDILAARGLLGRHKYLPYRAWFRGELRPYVRDVLTDPETGRSPFWSPEGLRRVADDHFSGRRNCSREIHAVLALEAVDRILIRQKSDAWSRLHLPECRVK